jgi:hypothetical protein
MNAHKKLARMLSGTIAVFTLVWWTDRPAEATRPTRDGGNLLQRERVQRVARGNGDVLTAVKEKRFGTVRCVDAKAGMP